MIYSVIKNNKRNTIYYYKILGNNRCLCYLVNYDTKYIRLYSSLTMKIYQNDLKYGSLIDYIFITDIETFLINKYSDYDGLFSQK